TLTPVYPTTEGISQTILRQLTEQALVLLKHRPLPELLPSQWLPNAVSLIDALQFLHRPSTQHYDTALELGNHPAQQQLIIEELLAHHISMLQARQSASQFHAPALPAGKLLQHFIQQLPFPLTGAQQHVIDEIKQDLVKPQPMMRLVQGDVRSGKTVVADISARIVSDNQQQETEMDH